MKKIPELRFPQFEEEFNSIYLGDLAIDISYGMNVAATEYDGENKYLRITDIDENNNCYIKTGIVSPNGHREDKFLLEEGDILFARTGASTGKTYYYKNSDGKVYYAGFLIRAKIRKDYDHRFVFYSTLTYRYKSWVNSMSARSGQPGINASEYSSYIVLVPKSKEEQQKIADFFSTIDSRIVIQEDKIKNLEEQKKGYMQRIFSQEIRFKDEDGEEYPEWEDDLLGNFCNITTGKLDANAMVEGGKYRFYTCAKDFFAIDNYNFDTEALLVSGNGANVGYIHYYKGKFNAYQRTYVLDGFENNIIYMKYCMDRYLPRRIYSEKKDGNTPYIVMSTLSEMDIKLPCIEEQQKIANFFSLFDEKIEIEKKILETLQELKRGFLQKMFV